MTDRRGTILIKHPLYVGTMDDQRQEFSGGHILIEDGTIKSIGPESVNIQADEVIDAAGCVVLPGFITLPETFL
jgi:cytosine/adenosine deaminase-related metal-dependent hydrolase